MLAENGFEVRRMFRVRNRYPLSYELNLAPLPGGLKRHLIPLLRQTSLGRLALSWNAGNFGIVGVRDSQ